MKEDPTVNDCLFFNHNVMVLFFCDDTSRDGKAKEKVKVKSKKAKKVKAKKAKVKLKKPK